MTQSTGWSHDRKLSLRNYNAQVSETYAMIKALNKLTGLGMPETQYVD